jgi:hypothetical protein
MFTDSTTIREKSLGCHRFLFRIILSNEIGCDQEAILGSLRHLYHFTSRHTTELAYF